MCKTLNTKFLKHIWYINLHDVMYNIQQIKHKKSNYNAFNLINMQRQIITANIKSKQTNINFIQAKNLKTKFNPNDLDTLKNVNFQYSKFKKFYTISNVFKIFKI